VSESYLTVCWPYRKLKMTDGLLRIC
jgi:hypothetical protein